MDEIFQVKRTIVGYDSENMMCNTILEKCKLVLKHESPLEVIHKLIISLRRILMTNVFEV